MKLAWVAYPVLVHTAVLTHSRALEALAIVLLVALALQTPLRTPRLWAWAALAGIAAAAAYASLNGWGLSFLYLPPVLIYLFLGTLFGRSLTSGQTPVITAFAARVRGDMPPSLGRYTRQLTLFWTALFAVLACVSLSLAIWAPTEVWSLFTNVISYLLLAAVFVAEFFLRRLLIPEIEHTGVASYVRSLLGANWRQS